MSLYINYFIFIVGIVIVGDTLWIIYHGLVSKINAQNTIPFSRELDNPDTVILMVGDSVMLGVGTKDSHHSLAGRMATLYPTSSISTRGIMGGKIRNIIPLVTVRPDGSKWDTIVIFAGGMDIIHCVVNHVYRRNLKTLFKQAEKVSHTVIFISPPNVGLAPIFPFPLSTLYTYRTKCFRRIAQSVATHFSVLYVDLFTEKIDSRFKNDLKLYSSDLSHPTDRGYGIWFSQIKKVLSES